MSEPLLPPIVNNAIAINISREMAIMHGLVEMTPEEAVEDEQRSREWHARSLAAWKVYDAAVPAIDALKDPVSLAVLEVHVRHDHPNPDWGAECEHCWHGDGDHERWPCETVAAVAKAHGIEVPDIECWHRPDPEFVYHPPKAIEYKPRWSFVDLEDR